MRLIDADELLLRFIPRGGDNNFTRFIRQTVRLRIEEAPTVDAKPIMMCNGEHIKCPAHKDYERGYKDGQTEAQMTAEQTKHGRWENKYISEETSFDNVPWLISRCSVCKKKLQFATMATAVPYAYCPNCGARMDEAAEIINDGTYSAGNLYECDPEKNTKCRKTGCYINGGECRQTSHAEYAKEAQE